MSSAWRATTRWSARSCDAIIISSREPASDAERSVGHHLLLRGGGRRRSSHRCRASRHVDRLDVLFIMLADALIARRRV